MTCSTSFCFQITLETIISTGNTPTAAVSTVQMLEQSGKRRETPRLEAEEGGTQR